MTSETLDEQALMAKMGLLGAVVQNAAVLGPIALGVRLGLYEALARCQPADSERARAGVGAARAVGAGVAAAAVVRRAHRP